MSRNQIVLNKFFHDLLSTSHPSSSNTTPTSISTQTTTTTSAPCKSSSSSSSCEIDFYDNKLIELYRKSYETISAYIKSNVTDRLQIARSCYYLRHTCEAIVKQCMKRKRIPVTTVWANV